MQIRAVFLLAVFGLLGLFAVLNWSAFLAPTTLNFLVVTTQAPLALVLLGFIALLSALFLAFALYLQGTALVEARRWAREIETQRELADKAEASRLQELRGEVAASHTAVLDRLDRIDRDFGGAFERTEAAIAAYVGELDDRLQRGGVAPKS